ncbi:MAG TPA: CPBP family intramembrane metalloprotease [Candidatus Latescibacteria bacterium]|nr:CPBP family intramembrane metalloprotease [Candidatus Handelsmanbacteria bacterium]HIL08440.1 CPBP family intramembrane metalloprotease [Candidatus Latescibacterota bacterium]
MKMSRLYCLVLVLLTSLFYLNDFSNMYVKSWRWWLFIDYVSVKLFPLLVVLWLTLSKKMRLSEFGLTMQTMPSFLVAFLAVTLVGTAIDQNGYPLIANLPGYAALGGMPAITNPIWDWIDLTFGLLMVGIFEELVFRGYMHTFLNRYTQSPFVIVIISSVAFGLIHWSLGLHAVLITSIIGAIFMITYLRTRSLPAIILAHFTINFIDFAGVIPKSVFNFF